ncbi:carbohydrate porin [Pararobbsia alpina]|uniref:Porin B n=1 Tax=Pararobbsia alpina TaxID=621374 RepID=A0A6S7BJP6_9BURK|nr:carbohydrate porin [Pararobbsia alpina]CAB3802693.1 Porin B [Pararobbsia alpina]
MFVESFVTYFRGAVARAGCHSIPRGCLSAVLSLSVVGPAFAQVTSQATPAPTPPQAEAPSQSLSPAAGENAVAKADPTPSAATGFWDRSNLFGDMGGLRPWLGNYGVTLSVQETSDLFNNFTGGVKPGAVYNGVAQLGLSVDTDKAFGLKGGQFFVDALQIQGYGISGSHLDVLQSANGVEADPGTRLWELWYQQSFGDKFDVKVGQQSLDNEFMISQYGALFVNAMFGWPALPSYDMPGGGPDYPLSSPGVRLRFKPSQSLTVLGGIFDANPAPGVGDPYRINPSGTNFELSNGVMMIGELQYSINQPPAAGSASTQPSGLPGTYKLGFWYNNERFPAPQYGTGLTFASPTTYRGDFSIYGIADQMIWRSSANTSRSLGVYAMAMDAPSNRNLIDFEVNAGLVLKAPFKGRNNDSAGISLGYVDISPGVRFVNNPASAQLGSSVPSGETVIEATYLCQVTPWWQVQADFQYFFSPTGGISNPANGAPVRNEAVVGLQTVVTF